MGGDGTVDLERFVILNPPVLVEDPAGPIVVTVQADPSRGIKAEEFRFREDLQESLLQSLGHTLSVKKQKYDSSKIVQGKKGNTTTTVYPDPDPESTSVDADIYINNGATWAGVHDATDGTVARPSDTAVNACNTEYNAGGYQISRGFFLFDTSAITDTDTIDSATLSLHIQAKIDDINDANAYCSIITTTPASNTDIVVGDFDQVGSTKQSDDIDITGVTTGAYNVWTLNGTGLGNISKTGITKFGIRTGHDIANSDIGATIRTSNLQPRMAEFADTTSDPKLVIEHSVAAPATSPTPQVIIIISKLLHKMQMLVALLWESFTSQALAFAL